MTRPLKKRVINFWPQVTYFKPAGIPLKTIEELEISGDELEAIRLKYLENLDQEKVAKQMNVSRPTIVRILQSAKKKIVDALVNGKAIKMEKGPNIIMKNANHKLCNKKRRCGRSFN